MQKGRIATKVSTPKYLFCACVLCLSANAHAQKMSDSLQQVKEVVVVGNNHQKDNLLLPQTGMVSLTADELVKRTALLGEPDVLRTLQTQAGVNGGVEGFSGLMVHGGENDENLFVLNHLPLYHVSHIGGLFSSFNVAMIDRMKFYKSGFPAQYGGRVSSISDISLKESDFENRHGQFSLGLLSGNVFYTAPIVKDRLAFSVAVRRSWTELATIPALAIINLSLKDEGKKKIGGYKFMDINLKLDYKINYRLKGYTHFYGGKDALKLGEEQTSKSGQPYYKDKDLLKLNWGSLGVATGLSYTLGTNSLLSLRGYHTHFSTTFKQNNEEKREDEREFTDKKNKNGIDDTGISAICEYTPDKWLLLKAGIDYCHHRYHPEDLEISSTKKSQNYKFGNTLQTIVANELSGWIDGNLSFGDVMQLSLGLRLTNYSSEGVKHHLIEPRVNARFSLSKNLSLKASYMRAHQFAQQVSNSYISLPTEAWQPIASNWKPLESDQISVGLNGNITKDCYFSIEGYYKWMRHLLEYKDGIGTFSTNLKWSEKLTEGKGWAYGIDLGLHKDKGRLTGSINYGLLWNMRQFESLNEGKPFHAKYDNRHKVNINANYKLKKDVELNASWTYVSGNRVTLALQNYKTPENSGIKSDVAPTGVISDKWGVGYYNSRNNIVLPAYHRLDLGVALYKHYPNGREGIWNFGLYNVYSRMNPIAVVKDGLEIYNKDGGRWTTKFKTLGLLPVIPSVSYTLKF